MVKIKVYVPSGNFTCGSCGNISPWVREIPRCLYCNISVCYKCKSKGFCPKCDEILLPEEKAKLRSGSRSTSINCRSCCVAMIFIPLSAYLVGFLLLFLPQESMIVGGTLLLIFAPIAAFFIFLYIRARRKKLKTAGKEEIDARLRLSSSAPVDGMSLTSSRDNAFCIQCGNKLSSDDEFCGNCGNVNR